MKYFSLALFVFIFLITGCGSSESAKENKSSENKKADITSTTTENSASNEGVDYDQLRKKANVAEAASAVGYDGKAIKRELNKVIDANEKLNKDLKDVGF